MRQMPDSEGKRKLGNEVCTGRACDGTATGDIPGIGMVDAVT